MSDDTTAAGLLEREIFVGQFGPIISKVAKREHKGAHTVSREDLEQHLWAEMLSKLKSVKGYTYAGIEGRAVEIARSYMLKERIDYMYFTGSFVYTPAIVEAYLQCAVWQEVEDVPDVDGRVDVKLAYDALTLQQRQVLYRKYALGEPPGVNDAAGRRMVLRAIDTITHRLNLGAQGTQVAVGQDNI